MRMSKNRLKGLYAITDPTLLQHDLVQQTEQAIIGGINILQYRNKIASIKQQEQEALTLASLCKKITFYFLLMMMLSSH